MPYHLSEHYLEAQEVEACEEICHKLLAVDACDEASHRQLMRCYSRQGHANRALRQFDLCVDSLNRELEVEPSQFTVELSERIRNRQAI